MPWEKENLALALGKLNDVWATRNGDADDRWAEAQWQDAMDNLADCLDAYIEQRVVELLTPALGVHVLHQEACSKGAR